jgi:hypothetical protein
MSAKVMPLDQVPGIALVRQMLTAIDREVVISAAGNDKDEEKYFINLTLQGRKGRATFPYNLLHDLRDNRESAKSQ